MANSPEPEPRIAVFIDVDNVRSSVESYLDTQLDFEAIIARIHSMGHVLLKRAYADWSLTENRVLRRVLQENGVEPVQVFVTSGMKNSADISLAIDCVEMMLTRNAIDTYVLVTGDSDFVPLVQRLRGFGKRVVGVGVRRQGTSHLLVHTCDRFEFYETIVARAPVDRAADFEFYRELLMRAVRTLSPAGEWVKEAPLRALMQRQDPSFDETNLGFQHFGDFVQACDIVEVSGPGGGDLLVRLAADEARAANGHSPEELADHLQRLLSSRHRVRSIPTAAERRLVFEHMLGVLAATAEVGGSVSFLELRTRVRALLERRIDDEAIDNLMYTLFYMYAFQFADDPELGTQERPARLAERIEPTPEGVERYYRRTILRWLIKDGAQLDMRAIAIIMGLEPATEVVEELEALRVGAE